jgi:hypothetical protein
MSHKQEHRFPSEVPQLRKCEITHRRNYTWDLWWDKVALGQVFSEFFGFPCNRRSLRQLLHNHPHVSSGECTVGQMWPQCWDLQGPRGLEQRDLRNLNLGDLKKGPNGDVSPTPQKKTTRDN